MRRWGRRRSRRSRWLDGESRRRRSDMMRKPVRDPTPTNPLPLQDAVADHFRLGNPDGVGVCHSQELHLCPDTIDGSGHAQGGQDPPVVGLEYWQACPQVQISMKDRQHPPRESHAKVAGLTGSRTRHSALGYRLYQHAPEAHVNTNIIHLKHRGTTLYNKRRGNSEV